MSAKGELNIIIFVLIESFNILSIVFFGNYKQISPHEATKWYDTFCRTQWIVHKFNLSIEKSTFLEHWTIDWCAEFKLY